MAEPASEGASDVEGCVSVLELTGVCLSCGSEQCKPGGALKQLPTARRASLAFEEPSDLA
jgi:hypothetical protein